MFLSFQEGSTRVVFAYHSEDPISPNNMKHHEFRGTKTILLLNSINKTKFDEPSWAKFNFLEKNVGNT